MRVIWAVILSSWLGAAFAGTPDHLMWVGKDQDALVMAEVKRINPDKSRELVVIASLAPSKWWSPKAKQRFTLQMPSLNPLAEYLMLQKGQKYFMSLRKVGQHYEPVWGVWPLTRDSQQLADAHLADYKPEYQFLLNTGARYPIPSFLFDEVALRSENPQIPNDVLKELPTEQLVQIYLTYPYLSLLQTSQPQAAFTQLQTRFNGLRELLKHPDSSAEVLKVLRTEPLGDVTTLPAPTLKALSQRQSALLLVLAQADLSTTLSAVDRLTLKHLVQTRLKQLQAADMQTSPMTAAYVLVQTKLQQH